MVTRETPDVETVLLQGDIQSHEITRITTDDNGYSRKGSFFLYFATTVVSLTYFVVGACGVWSSPVLPKLTSNNTDINPLDHPLSSYEISLMAGLITFGNVLSPFICGKLLDVIGRRNTIALSSSVCVAALIMTAFTSNVICFLIGRLIIGIYAGCVMIAVPIFLSEISSDHNRGKIGCILISFISLGQLYTYILGPLFSVRNFTLICVIPGLVHIASLLTFVPDSPVHFLRKGNRNEAAKSLRKFRGNICPQEIDKEIQLLEYSFEQSKQRSDAGLITLITDQPTRRGCLIATIMLCVQLGSGIGIIFPFMGPIFEEAKTGLSGDMTAVFVCSLKAVLCIIVSQIVERTGRKPLLLYSTVFCSISLFLLGLCFFMKENSYSSYQSFMWLPVASVFFYIVTYSIGLGPVPMATMSELFNSNVRSTAVSTVMFLSRIFNTVSVSVYPLGLYYIGNSGFMWIFSLICALGAIFFSFCMPETKGKSFHEIQKVLRHNKSDCDDKTV